MSELPSVTLIRFYGLEDSDASEEARRAARRLRKNEQRAALVLRVLLEARRGRPLEDPEVATADHRAAFLAGCRSARGPNDWSPLGPRSN